jgi:hypothetical protein
MLSFKKASVAGVKSAAAKREWAVGRARRRFAAFRKPAKLAF